MVGSFGDVVFEISDKKVFSINNEINRAYKSKIEFWYFFSCFVNT